MDFIAYLIPADSAHQQLLNTALHSVHSGMVLFMMTGWAFRRLLTLHRTLLALIWGSWLGLGWWIGYLGYCILTDWHWNLKEAMGEYGMPPSYIEYMLWQLGSGDLPDTWVMYATAGAFVVITLLSVLRKHRPIAYADNRQSATGDR